MLKYIFLLITLTLTISCNPREVEAVSCEKLIPEEAIENTNSDLRIVAVDEYDDSDLSELVIVVDNFSDKVLRLSPNDDLKVYFLINGAWVQQKSLLDYPSFLEQIGVKSANDSGGLLYSFFYNPLDLPDDKSICITIVATKDPLGEAELVSSFYQFTKTPK